jgi:alpha-1,6-mannosyltransferase
LRGLRTLGTVSLVGVGLISEAVYLAVVMRLPWWRYGDTLHSWSQLLGGSWGGGALCVAGIGVLMAVYLGGWYAVRQGAADRRVVWGFAVLFALTLFGLLPITSDLFTYLVRADLLTDLGVNPLLRAPLQVADSSLLSAYRSHYLNQPSIYGPVWLLLSAPGALGDGVAGGLIYLKGLAVAAYLGCAWLLERILRQRGRQDSIEGLYLFAWNPLVVLMAVGDGHNDVVMMAAVLLASWLLLNRRWILSFAILALSVWIKVGELAGALCGRVAW